MKRIVRLTESDLTRIVRRIVLEQEPIGMPNPSTGKVGGGGPLTGTLVVENKPMNVRFGETLNFRFREIKNSGKLPITIKRFVGSSDNMFFSKQVPFTLQPGETFQLEVKVKLQKGGTTTRPDQNGVVNYDVPFYIMTDGKKERYQFYCRQTLYFDEM
jgi:hypothetical protein